MPTTPSKVPAAVSKHGDRCEHTGVRRDDCACPACVRALVERFCGR